MRSLDATGSIDRERAAVLLRILPPGSFVGRPHALFERSLRVYRRGWLIILSGFVEPLLYLLSFGTGLGAMVGTVQGPGGESLKYAAFIAPALLATSAMQGAIADSSFNVFFKLKFEKLYDAVLATPLGPMDVALGEIAWAVSRGGLYAIGFVVIMLVMGLISSWWAVLLVPGALLVAFAFAAVGMAATTYMRGIADLDLIQLVMLPMFLFSGTFFGLDVYPGWIRIVVELLPLHHGVALLRALSVGAIDAGLLVHVAYFVVLAAVGVWITSRRLGTLLLS